MAVVGRKFRVCQGMDVYEGTGNFVGTATTCVVPVPFTEAYSASATYIGTPALADGPISINETVSSEGRIALPAAKTMTVTRVAGSTSGQKFSFSIKGR